MDRNNSWFEGFFASLRAQTKVALVVALLGVVYSVVRNLPAADPNLIRHAYLPLGGSVVVVAMCLLAFQVALARSARAKSTRVERVFAAAIRERVLNDHSITVAGIRALLHAVAAQHQLDVPSDLKIATIVRNLALELEGEGCQRNMQPVLSRLNAISQAFDSGAPPLV